MQIDKLLKVRGKTFVMVLLCHSSECGLFEPPSLFRVLELSFYFSFSVVTQNRASNPAPFA